MQSIILKVAAFASVVLLMLLALNCNRKSDSNSQIAIKINSVNKLTKQYRINQFDTVVVRKEGVGFLTKSFDKVGEYITDSTGSVKIKIDPSKIYDISVSGLNVLGGDMYYPGQLKNGQEVNIEVTSFEK